MNEKVKGFGNKVKEGIGKVSKTVWRTVIIVLIILVAAAVVIAIALNNRPYSVLFADMSSDEMSAVISYLEEQGVTDYQVENNDTILVPSSQEPNLKARLLMEGYPNTGFSYSTYYDNISSLSTESERDNAYLMLLQDRMGAVIECLDGVQEAVVTIAPGEDRSYVLDSGNVVEASASVVVTMRDGSTLSNEQANAIRNLVARAVQGLEVDSVTISDNLGNLYTMISDGGPSVDASQLKLQLEEQINNRVRTSVMQVLIPFFGEDHVKVSVHTNVDVDKTLSESTTYDLPEWAADGSTDGEGIIGSKVYDHIIIRGEDDTVGGVVGAEVNSDLTEYVEEEYQADGNEEEIGVSGQVDYRTDTHNTYVERTSGVITDCSVSVSIDSATAGNVDVPSIRQHVARAAGINAVVTEEITEEEYLESKISVLTRDFFREEAPSLLPGEETVIEDWMIYAAIGGGLLFIILLVIILIVSRKRKKKKQAIQATRDEEEQQRVLDGLLAAALGGQQDSNGADVMSLQTEKSMELRKDIRQFADSNPEIAAQMVKNWLKGGDENG